MTKGEKISASKMRHGQSAGGTVSKTLATFYQIIKRCYSRRCISFGRYGGRGIKVCDRWRFGEGGKRGSECFIEDMGQRPSNEHRIERIDNDGDYSPSNCRWSTRTEQANNKRSNRLLAFAGRTQTLAQWARELGLNYDVLSTRINQLRWSVERAFNTKPRMRRS